MSIRYQISFWGILMLLFSCHASGQEYEKTNKGIIVTLSSDDPLAPKKVRMEVVSDKIIRVSSSPYPELPSTESLMITEDLPSTPPWKVEQHGDSLLLQTTSLQAWISKQTGEITFKDKEGKPLLQEEQNGKAFGHQPEVGDEKVIALSQRFKSTAQEAFYGLGQQQTGVFNYKGYHVDLTQYNSVVAVPFMISSQNYGILWDNYSITKFGDDRKPMPLSELRLFDKDGNTGALSATYANDRQSPGEGVVKKENAIAYEFLDDLEKIPSEFDMGKGALIWEGKIQANDKGLHRFHMTFSGYIKVWIDGKLLVDRWRESWNPGQTVFSAELGDQAQTFKMEWIPESTQSFISLKFLPPNAYHTQETFAFRSEAGKMLDYYFIAGDGADEIISGYRLLTGKAQIMPKWAFGFWQSRERYKTQEELLQTIAEFRKREIPIDNIVQDWSYWPENAWGSHEFDKERFPDPENMIQQVHDQYHGHIMISVWPKFYEGTAHYKTLDEKGWLYQQNVKNRQKDWIGEGYVSTFYDAYHPEARQIFWEQINEKLYHKGIDAWWLDATEPDIYSNASIDHRKTLMNPTAKGSATEFFNGYPLVNAKGIYHGQRATNPDKRVFILTRSAFPGIQRYGAATWSGDISSRFDELEQQIPAGLNFSLSGLPYWTTDIGGFFVEDKYDRPDPQGEALEEWRELNTRWYQYGTFTPLYRAHGQYPFREVFHIAPEEHPAYQSIVFYNKLRYRLMPYIYSLAGKIHYDDYTLMRPLFMDFDHDSNTCEVKDQFMFGPSLMVNPVYQYKAENRDIYFPSGQGWYDLLTGEFQAGGLKQNIPAPYEKIPLYVPEGAIIPFGPAIQYTSEKPADEIHLYVYAGKDGSFELYEDDGEDYGYEQGKYLRIPIHYNDSQKELTIGDQKGNGFEGSLSERTFHIHYVQKEQAQPLSFEAKSEYKVNYTGKMQHISLQ